MKASVRDVEQHAITFNGCLFGSIGRYFYRTYCGDLYEIFKKNKLKPSLSFSEYFSYNSFEDFSANFWDDFCKENLLWIPKLLRLHFWREFHKESVAQEEFCHINFDRRKSTTRNCSKNILESTQETFWRLYWNFVRH